MPINQAGCGPNVCTLWSRSHVTPLATQSPSCEILAAQVEQPQLVCRYTSCGGAGWLIWLACICLACAYLWCVSHMPCCCVGDHGGSRRECHTFATAAQAVVEFHAWQLIQHDPRSVHRRETDGRLCTAFSHPSLPCACVCVRRTLYELASQLSSRFGVSISRSWVCRMFKRWRWTFKNVSQKHTNKFHWNNIRTYGHFLVHVRNVPMVRIKYCDEASFASRSKCMTCSSEIHTCCTDTCYICICRYSC